MFTAVPLWKELDRASVIKTSTQFGNVNNFEFISYDGQFANAARVSKRIFISVCSLQIERELDLSS